MLSSSFFGMIERFCVRVKGVVWHWHWHMLNRCEIGASERESVIITRKASALQFAT